MATYISWILTFPVLVMFSDIYTQEVFYQPEQIHLSYGDNTDEMVVTWVTTNYTEPSVVEYGLSMMSLTNIAKGQVATLFIDGGPEKRTFFSHKVVLRRLQPATVYYYHVGSPKGWSGIYFFKSMNISNSWSPVIAVFGDMGNANAHALPYLQKELEKSNIDIALHIGDFAYDMNKDNGKVGDAFMNQIQSIAAYIPYMTCVGNHEYAYLNIGPAHIISISTEGYYYDHYNLTGATEAVQRQYKWLEKDLLEANKENNRQMHPWIIVVGHRPMYCSNDELECSNSVNNLVRNGNPVRGMPGLEELFYKYGVDVQFYAHEHSYERFYPVYNMTVCGGEKSMYVNPEAPVFLISGSGGDDEGQTGYDPKHIHPWSAFHSTDYGYTRMKLTNKTHINFEQISIDQGGKIIDELTLIKTKFGSGIYNCHKKP